MSTLKQLKFIALDLGIKKPSRDKEILKKQILIVDPEANVGNLNGDYYKLANFILGN